MVGKGPQRRGLVRCFCIRFPHLRRSGDQPTPLALVPCGPGSEVMSRKRETGKGEIRRIERVGEERNWGGRRTPFLRPRRGCPAPLSP